MTEMKQMKGAEMLQLVLHSKVMRCKECAYGRSCLAMKLILGHIETTHLDPDDVSECEVPMCRPVRLLLRHWRRCLRGVDCTICYLQKLAQVREAEVRRIVCLLT